MEYVHVRPTMWQKDLCTWCDKRRQLSNSTTIQMRQFKSRYPYHVVYRLYASVDGGLLAEGGVSEASASSWWWPLLEFVPAWKNWHKKILCQFFAPLRSLLTSYHTILCMYDQPYICRSIVPYHNICRKKTTNQNHNPQPRTPLE